MPRSIPIALERLPEIEIDAGLVAQRFGLPVPEFRDLLASRRITQLCERGTGLDAGRFRASFYLDGRRVRIVVDASGTVLDASGPESVPDTQRTF